LQRETLDAKAIDLKASTANLEIDQSATDAEIKRHYARVDAAARRAQRAYQNAYAFVVSGLVYEARGEYNDAYIDYKKAHALQPNIPFLKRNLLTLSKQLGFRQEHAQWQAKFKHNSHLQASQPDTDTPDDNTQGELVVLFEQGLIAAKQEIAITIPDLSGRYHSIALPTLQEPARMPSSLRLTYQQRAAGETDQGLATPARSVATSDTHLLTETYPMAAKALTERRATLLAHQLGRSFSKAHLHHLSEKEGGAIGSLVANLYNIVTERADLRSWLTLPHSLQATRISAEIGTQRIQLQDLSTGKRQYHTVKIMADRLTLVYIISVQGRLYVRSTIL
jgi:hypothetical protein